MGYYSEAEVEDNKVVKIKSILRKERIVDMYKSLGEEVVFVGDGNNDLRPCVRPTSRYAAGLTHYPAKSLYSLLIIWFLVKKLYADN